MAIQALGIGLICGAQVPPKQKPPVQEEAPPEEDPSAKPKEYAFNPLQAEKEMRIGNYYFKRGKYRAAADRYHEATLWNPTLAEAFERWGEAAQKQHDNKAAKEAYGKYLEVAPGAKDAPEIKKKLAKL
jgi:tetratricopeptide (TPR) repeat protein